MSCNNNSNINETFIIESGSGASGVTGGTFNYQTQTLTLNNSDDTFVNINGFQDNFTTGATLVGNVVHFDRTNELSAYTLSLSAFSNSDIYVTGVTYNNSLLTFYRNDNVNLEVGIDSFSGLTVNGGVVINGNLNLPAISEGIDYDMLTIDSDGNIHKKQIPLNKITIKEINLGSRLLHNDYYTRTQIVGQLSHILNQREVAYILTKVSSYSATKIAYYYTLNYSPLTSSSERNKYLSAIQTFNGDYDSDSAFGRMYDDIVSSSYFYDGISVNFYCEVYIESDINYLAPTQLNLVNPLFNSLRPDKYSRHKNYMGYTEYVQDNNEINKLNTNTIYSNLKNPWDITYDTTIGGSNYDIPKSIYEIVNTGGLFGSLSADSRQVLGFEDWSTTSRDNIKLSTYVESVRDFKRNFKIPVNLNTGTVLNLYRLHNFYGTLIYGDGSTTLTVYPNNVKEHNSKTFLQMVDTYRLFPSGHPKLIYSNNEPNLTKLVYLTYNLNDYNLKYLSNRVNLGTYKAGDINSGSGILQVMPRYCENYVLGISINNNIFTPDNFLNDLFQNYFYGNDPSIKSLDNGWIKIFDAVRPYLANQGALNENPYGPYILLQSSEDVINKIKAKPYWEDTTPLILVGGQFSWDDSSIGNRLTELDINGNFTADLDVQSGFDDYVQVITTDSNNGIYVGGNFTLYQGYDAVKFIKLRQDGSIDTSFTAGFFNGLVRAITLQSDGKILVGGDFSAYYDRLNDQNHNYTGLVRLNTDGSFDTTFNNNNNPLYNGGIIGSIIIQPDNKILIGGFFFDYYDAQNFLSYSPSCIARINIDGSIDTSFITAHGLGGFNSSVLTMNLLSNGKILVGGSFDTYYDSNSGYYYPQYFCRLNSDGSFDTTFLGDGLGFNDTVSSIIVQSDDKIVVGGYFQWFYNNSNNYNTNYLVRMDKDGNFDSTFVQDGYGFNSFVYCLTLQSDGKILVGGDFSTYTTYNNFWETQHIIRLNSDGTADYTNGNYFHYPVYAIVLNNRINGTINFDSIYKGHSFKPSLYPLNQTQLLLDVPETFVHGEEKNNHRFNTYLIDGNSVLDKELCLIVNFKKINQKAIIKCPLKTTDARRANDNIFNTLTPIDYDIETLIYSNLTETFRKHLRPNNVEIYFGIIDTHTRITSILPNYKMIIENYGNNEIFKIVQGGIEI